MADIVGQLAGLGFKHIELSGNVRFGENIAAAVIHLRAKYGLDFLIHNDLPFELTDFVPNLASTNGDQQLKAGGVIKEAIMHTRKVGKDLYRIHPGFIYDFAPEQLIRRSEGRTA